MMQYEINALKRNRDVFETMLRGLSPSEYNWVEKEGKWTLLEVVCHLYDEEREDFKARVASVLEDPEKPFVKIDPAGWVTSRKYSGENFEIMLDKFLTERDASVKWLNSLTNPKWDNSYNHPQVGSVRADFLLINWVAHDYLHIRQITRVLYNYLHHSTGRSLDYAGEW